jgi:hypothetical protein
VHNTTEQANLHLFYILHLPSTHSSPKILPSRAILSLGRSIAHVPPVPTTAKASFELRQLAHSIGPQGYNDLPLQTPFLTPIALSSISSAMGGNLAPLHDFFEQANPTQEVVHEQAPHGPLGRQNAKFFHVKWLQNGRFVRRNTNHRLEVARESAAEVFLCVTSNCHTQESHIDCI